MPVQDTNLETRQQTYAQDRDLCRLSQQLAQGVEQNSENPDRVHVTFWLQLPGSYLCADVCHVLLHVDEERNTLTGTRLNSFHEGMYVETYITPIR